jgi:hypothetical protein
MCRSRRVGAVPADALKVAVERGGAITTASMALGDHVMHSVLVIRSVRRERHDGIGDLVEKRAGPLGVIDVFFRQFDRDNLAASGIDAYV